MVGQSLFATSRLRGEESPNTIGQGATSPRRGPSDNRGSCGQYPAGTERVTENMKAAEISLTPGTVDKISGLAAPGLARGRTLL